MPLFVPSIDHIVAATTDSGPMMNDRPDAITSSPEGDLQAASNVGPVSQGSQGGWMMVLMPVYVEDEEGG